MIGDGSFQLTAQEIAQMIRYKVPVVMFLISKPEWVVEYDGMPEIPGLLHSIREEKSCPKKD